MAIARHLDGLTATAQPPAFANPNYYAQDPPPYTEYASEVSYLSSGQRADDSGYWESTATDAVNYIKDQAGPSYPYPPPVQHTASNPMAHTIFQQTSTMSPSSSSLAFALGSPQRPPPQAPEDSSTFFNHYLAERTRELSISRSESPRQFKAATIGPGTVTPRKRKPVVELVSPSLKRVHSQQTFSSPSILSSPTTSVPATPSTTFSATPSSTWSKGTAKKTLAFVSVPSRPWTSPSTSRKGIPDMEDSPDDLGGYGPIDSSPGKSTGRRTGDRDERVPLDKLTSFLDDVMEAEDSLPPDLDFSSPSASSPNHNSPLRFFSSLTVDPAAPLLSPTVIRKISKYVSQVARPTKPVRLRAPSNGFGLASPIKKGKGRMNEVDTQILGRILRILKRSVKAGEDLDPLHLKSAPSASKPSSPVKKSKKGKKKSPQEGEDVDMEDETQPPEENEPSDIDFERMNKEMEVARDSVLAAECIILFLGSDRLAKELYSEEIIKLCLSTTKNQLSRIIYPVVEASSPGSTITSPLLQALLKPAHSNDPLTHANRFLGELFQALSSLLPAINNLLNPGDSNDEVPVAMSEDIIIQTVYIAIEPFFVSDSSDAGGKESKASKGKKDATSGRALGKTAMKGLRLDALSLIRSIFAHHESQRNWIVEEILSSLIKLYSANQKAGQFRLRDGRSIRTVSALLMQLVQTSAHDVRIQAREIEKKRRTKIAMRQGSFSESQASLPELPQEDLLDELDLEEVRMYTSGLESAKLSAKSIIVFLTQRSGKGKATKNSNEQEYRTILDNLISDVLSVLFWPEWPAAALILTILVKFMLASLDDVTTASSQSDNNAAKTIALDHLGIIAARIKTAMLRREEANKPLKPLDEITSKLNSKDLERLLNAHYDLAIHLSKRSSDDQTYDSAQELTSAMFGQELAQALQSINKRALDVDGQLDAKTLLFSGDLKRALKDVWKDRNTDVFDAGSQEEIARIDRLSEELGSVQYLKNVFPPILAKILQALDAPPIFVRTKALRALGQIVTSDATILSNVDVRRSIEIHLLDSSPAVRDAAVELIGKYMVDRPDVAGAYYQRIAERIADTGLSVRKRVIKLLKSFYSVITDTIRQVDICTRLVLRMGDEDESVKDLAIKTLEDLWFPATVGAKTKGQDKAALLSKVTVIMGVSGNFKDRQSPLEDLLHKLMSEKEGSEASSLNAHYTEICETLIDGLVDATDLPGFTVVNCVRTVYLFVAAHPDLLTVSNASTLRPYLKNATTHEDQVTSDYLLKIFRVSIPSLPKTAAKFGTELQTALQPMILKPSSIGGLSALQETVACMCAVVQNLTHDFPRLIALLKSCNTRIQQAISRPVTKEMEPNDVKGLSILIFIVCLLAEHCDFNQLRETNPSLQIDISAVSPGSITEHVYQSVLKLHTKYDNAGLRARILQCLGFLFRAQPTLMTQESSASLMDQVFQSEDQEARGRLLKIMQEFLISEAEKNAAKQKESASAKKKNSKGPANVNMEELIGNTDGFADSGVSSAVVQRYLNPILDAVLSQNPQIQLTAIDILSFTIKQGLAHPLQSFPVIIALETSSNPALCNRASALHFILHTKHASLLNTRYTVSARASFDYQMKICESRESVRGFRLQNTPVALLQRWYSLVREKRPIRQDFLKSLVKVYQDRPAYFSEQDDVDFARYMSENFSAFEYKTQEEVLTVIKYLTDVLSTTGMALLEIVSPSHLVAQLRGGSAISSQPAVDPNAMAVDVPVESAAPTVPQQSSGSNEIPVIRTTVTIAMVMLLKSYLKNLYGLSEDKCQKFVIGKKSAIGDKAVTKKHDKPISWERLQFATKPILTTEDVAVQKTQFLETWNEDGVSGEPVDEFEA